MSEQHWMDRGISARERHRDSKARWRLSRQSSKSLLSSALCPREDVEVTEDLEIKNLELSRRHNDDRLSRRGNLSGTELLDPS